MFVMVLLFCLGGVPGGKCLHFSFPPRPMESAEACTAMLPHVAELIAVRDGWLDKGFLPVGGQCFEKIPEEPGIES